MRGELGRREELSLPRENTPEIVRIAVVGVGYWGPNLIRNFASLPGCVIRWVCDRKPGRLQFIHERWPWLPLTQDYDQILKDPSVDAVIIAAPVSSHFPLAMAALEAGKHVLVEKPLAATSEQATRMIELAAQKSRILATGHIYIYHPAVVAMKSFIERGDLGQPCYAESSRINAGPPASEVDVIWDLAVHDLAISLYLWGQEPVEITAYGQRFRHQTLTDVAFIYCRFADGSLAQHHVSWLSPERIRHFFLAGMQGSLLFNDALPEHKLWFTGVGTDTRRDLRDEDTQELSFRPGPVIVPDLPQTEPLRLECEHFIECVRTNRIPRADGHAGLAVVRLLEAAERSLDLGSHPVPLR